VKQLIVGWVILERMEQSSVVAAVFEQPTAAGGVLSRGAQTYSGAADARYR
jgi:hypothetical protein